MSTGSAATLPGYGGGRTWDDRTARALLRKMFDAAVQAADPRSVLPAYLPERPRGRCVVVGAGKAAAAMAIAVETAWPDVDLTGAVVTPHGHGLPTTRIAVREAAHPVPDVASEAAAREMLDLVAGLGTDDLVLSLISGGGSSLMALPANGLTLIDKQHVNRALLASGLDIRSMNAVRRRLSAIKGGKLAQAASPARVVTLAISDVPGDDAAAIASGPTVPDPDAHRDLAPLAEQLRGSISKAAFQRLIEPARPSRSADNCDVRLIATPGTCLLAAAEVARRAGVDVVMLGDDLEGESRALGEAMVGRAPATATRPCVLLSGGETTVMLSGQQAGRGGRNTEFALAVALALNGAAGIWALAADTDGEDGASGGAAGAVVTPDTLARGLSAGLNAADYLAGHDSGTFFSELDDLVVTGPTHTNVNDFRAILITAAASRR